MSMRGANAGLKMRACLNETGLDRGIMRLFTASTKCPPLSKGGFMMDVLSLIPPTAFLSLKTLLKIIVAEFFDDTGK